MIYLDRYHPDGKFAPLHDIDFYRRYDIIGMLRQYAEDQCVAHPSKSRTIHDKVAKAIEWEKREMAWLGIVGKDETT